MNNEIAITKVTELHQVNFNGQKFIGTYEQLVDLCIALEGALFDEPTYDDLNEKVIDLRLENDDLKEELENLNANFEDKLEYRLRRF